jgi:ribonuclease Z
MKLVLLGTGGLIPTDQAQTACYFLPEVGVLLDAGTGLYRMNRYLCIPELDVYLTHAHGDHTTGLPYLFAASLVHQIQQSPEQVDENNIRSLTARANQFLHSARVHATREAIDFLASQYAAYQINWQLMQAQEPLSGGGTITSFRVGEGDEIGFRLDWPGHSMAYVTDTVAGPDSPYLEAIRGVNLLVHDCNGPDSVAKLMSAVGHSSTSAVAKLAAQAGAGRLVLVHHAPIEVWAVEEDLEAARVLFPATQIGQDGMEIEF